MANFKLDGRMKVKTLKANFKKEFGASLRVYTTVACKTPADDEKTLAALRAEGYKGGELVVGGNATQPSQYNYYGVIDGTSHQLLGVKYTNIKNTMISGDYVTIKGGSTFKFGSTILYVESDITAKPVWITAYFDDTVACWVDSNVV